MVAADNAKTRAWSIFDRIVEGALVHGEYTNPWTSINGTLAYDPDFAVLEKLLGVPLLLRASSQSGVPALALDVWVAYELRRAGFASDSVWPRATSPRIVPTSVTQLIEALPKKDGAMLRERLSGRSAPKGVVSSSASILGKNYKKQVDVIMSSWDTGPEILVSTKRMDSSFGKNAANRVEESYGDAKNLRGRHPLAALGFVYGLRSTILTQEPDAASWLIDLLQKLGREDDAYDAVCLLMMEYADELAPLDGDGAQDAEDALQAAGVGAATEEAAGEVEPDTARIPVDLTELPKVRILHQEVPPALQAATFLRETVSHVLETTPVTMHREARSRRSAAVKTSSLSSAWASGILDSGATEMRKHPPQPTDDVM